MTRMTGDYPIGRATGVCAASGEPLEPGATCVATLCEATEDESLVRLDFSTSAWEAGDRPDGLFSFWRTIVPEPNERKQVFVDDAVVMDIFERLAEDKRPQRIAFRFVLSLALMRKRKLRFIERRPDGDQGIMLVLPKGAEPETPPIEVIDPGLTDDDVREISAELTEILQSDL